MPSPRPIRLSRLEAHPRHGDANVGDVIRFLQRRLYLGNTRLARTVLRNYSSGIERMDDRRRGNQNDRPCRSGA